VTTQILAPQKAEQFKSVRRAIPLFALALAATTVAMEIFTIVVAARLNVLGQVFGPSLLLGLSMAIVGGLIASRRPRELIGWLLLFIGTTQALVEFAGAYADLAYLAGAGLPAPQIFAWINTWMWMPGLGSLVTFLLLLFPNGHLPSPRWRWLAFFSGAVLVFAIAAVAITSWSARGAIFAHHGGDGPPPGSLAGLVFGPSALIIGGCALASISSLVFRYRRADPDTRHQLKWFALAATYAVTVAGPLDFIHLQGPAAAAALILQSLGVLGLASAIGIAIFRYRLYDIDVVISRTLVYGALAAFITAVYVGIVVGVGTLVGSGGQPNLALSIVATAIVAVAFQPVRERLQKIANRLVYGKRATPYEVLSQFSERVAETYTADEALPRMARVLAEGTGAERAEVWLRAGDLMRRAATWPQDAAATEPARVVDGLLPDLPGSDRVVAVRHQGDLLGALAVTKRTGESLTPVEEKLLTDLAAQAGLVLKNVGLTAELVQRLEELRASRQRLVAAQDEERRRLERNLHDGAQQNLVALKVKLGLVEMFADKDPARARATLAELKADADDALETLRDLARGIYPPLLADKGLAAALESQARKATLPVEVSAGGIGRYPQDIEAAVYFCVLEALQNVQKYAGARAAMVSLGEVAGRLTFEVADDGAGFDIASQKKGSGTQNMADRIDALGGHLEVDSTPGRGTRVSGELPARELEVVR
jgi:signal transduction histidine kinase